MLIIPAIDLLNGGCVRLQQGDYNAVTQYDAASPEDTAKSFFDAGATRLHVVDLDAAKSGAPTNTAAIQRILAVAQTYNAQVQIGGGLRTRASVQAALQGGAAYAVLGTAAVKDPALREQVITDHPGQIFIGVDVKDGNVAISGWQENAGIAEADFLQELHRTPPAAIIYTDISRDGMQTGNNAAATAAAAAAAPCPLIASGGIGSIAHLEALQEVGNIAGVIIGQALYSGRVALADALKLCA